MDIAPFRALRYTHTDRADIEGCVSLPYDQFGAAGRDQRYRRHPHNVVRLIKPRGDGSPPHDLARDTLRAWRRDGVVAADPLSVYPYRQRFARPGGAAERWSVIVRLKLTPFESGPTKPHERTYPDTVGERSHLREVVGADLGLILVVYDDPDGSIDGFVRRAGARPALVAARDESGTDNALWGWSDAGEIAALQARLAAASGFIADGHHRYTAALAHWQSRGARADDAAGYVMAAMVSTASAGLRILPTHRLTAAAPGAADIEAWRGAGLRIERIAASGDVAEVAAVAARHLGAHVDDHAVIYVHGDDAQVCADLVCARRGSLSGAPWPADVPQSWRGLDVAVLHSLMLDPWMADILRSQTEDHGALDYCNEIPETVAKVARRDCAAAFLINPLRVDEVRQVVAAGDVLPPKSTNFYPKVIAGLTINPFEA